MKIGIIGCGNISNAYLRLAPMYSNVNIIGCADIDASRAQALASEFSIEAMSVDQILSDESIELIVNLTVPKVHEEVSTQILQAGKHVYSEKPFVLSLRQGQSLQKLAQQQNRRIGSAPDTFLGGAHQCARELIDAGRVGDIVGGTCYFMNHGMEAWHPNPDFFYADGGGPMLDMGVYYLTNLVQLIGPAKRLMAMSSKAFATRTIACEPRTGEVIPVSTPTTVNALVEFHNGAQISLGMSWDVWQHEHNCMELYGTEGTLHVPDPNFFGGELRIENSIEQEIVVIDHPFGVVNDAQHDGEITANYRGSGLADMIDAIASNKLHRCNDTLALHVVDIITSAMHSGETGEAVTLSTYCERPEALNASAATSLLTRRNFAA